METDNLPESPDLTSAPLEVKLVSEVTACRACNWFWKDKPYGPYPVVDFQMDYPQEVLDDPGPPPDASSPEAPFFWLKGRCTGQELVNPQILHGCRKAPIMTIGINPNLTAFWPGPKGGSWAYPFFDTYAKYAYHYRHRTLYQESIPFDLIRQYVNDQGAIRAKGRGKLTSAKRAMAERVITLTIAYEDEALGIHEEKHYWTVGDPLVLLHYAVDDDAPWQFDAGDIIAGHLELPSGIETDINHNLTGYYQRFVPILEQVQGYMRAQGHHAQLEMAEDVCQLDMVACASPGWSNMYEIDKDEVVAKCVVQNAWAIKQLVQTQPAVIVFAGQSAFKMFADIFGYFIYPDLKLRGEVYEMLTLTTRKPYYLRIEEQVGDQTFIFQSRIVIAPHFSYDDNYIPQARFSPGDWEDFENKHADAIAYLRTLDLVQDPTDDGYVAIPMTDVSALKAKFPDALFHLVAHLYDPLAMVANAIQQEILLGNLVSGTGTAHLARSQGPCSYCVNDYWHFPEGCAYGKPDEPSYPPEFLEAVVASIVKKVQNA